MYRATPAPSARLGEEQLLFGLAPVVHGHDTGERTAVRHQEIVDVVLDLQVVETTQQRLQAAQHHG